jgi:TRAP-type C4-dicarboxylate transport system permease small subunit
MQTTVLPWYKRLAEAVSTLSLGVVFVLFIYGVGMRYLFNRPISWTDEAVTVLAVWSVLWTGAFVLRWSEHISFDIVFVNLAPKRQRRMLLIGNAAFVVLMLAALPGMVDYTLFLWREKTDMLEMRLDFVYAIFPIFFIAIVARQLLSLRRLMSSNWQAELARWTGDDQRESP